MSDNPLVSVIVPIYKVEDYLQQCIDSIINQSYSQIEIILVDDGSPDDCGKICDRYAHIDERIISLHKKNGGLSDARNFGLKQSHGEYVAFIDSDDYVHKDYIKFLLDMCLTTNSDISCCAGLSFYDVEPVSDINYSFKEYSNDEALKMALIRRPIGVSAWGKLFSKQISGRISFPVGKLYEDIQVIPYIFVMANKICISDNQMYYWRQRSNSITHRELSERDLDLFSCLERLVLFVDKEFDFLHQAVVCRFVTDSIGMIIQRLVYNKEYLSIINSLKKKYKDIWMEAISNRYLGLIKKAQVIIIFSFPKIYCCLMKTIFKNRC